jgi:hypothetical protein
MEGIVPTEASGLEGRVEVFARLRPTLLALPPTGALGASGRRGNNAVAVTPLKSRGVHKLVSPVLAAAPRPIHIAVECSEPFRSASGLSTAVNFSFDGAAGDQRFELDGVFESQHGQREIWEALGKPHIASILDGFNSTIFAYGRTCSGKTHTITGPIGRDSWALTDLEKEDADAEAHASPLGLVPRALYALLRAVEVHRESRRFTASFACAEIYNKSLFDLCAESGESTEAAARVEVRDGRMTTAAADRLSWHDVDLRAGHEEDALLAVQAR